MLRLAQAATLLLLQLLPLHCCLCSYLDQKLSSCVTRTFLHTWITGTMPMWRLPATSWSSSCVPLIPQLSFLALRCVVYLCSHLMVVKLCALDPAAVLSGVEVRCVSVLSPHGRQAVCPWSRRCSFWRWGALCSQLLHKWSYSVTTPSQVELFSHSVCAFSVFVPVIHTFCR